MPIEPRTATVTIYTGDYLDEIRHLEQRAIAARDASGGGLAGTLDESPEYLDIAAQHDALVAEAEKSALHVKVRALGRREWKDLVAKHPPRSVSEAVDERTAAGDRALGVNEDTFKDALVPLSVAEPKFTEDDFDAMADIDFDRIYLTAFSLNRGAAADPKASLVSRLTPTSDET